MTTTNAALVHPVLTLTVLDKGIGWLDYKLFHEKGKRSFTFKGTLSVDYYTIEKMEVGNSYAVRQTVDQTNTTHWASAERFYNSSRKPTFDPISQRYAETRTVPVVNPNLIHILDIVEF